MPNVDLVACRMNITKHKDVLQKCWDRVSKHEMKFMPLSEVEAKAPVDLQYAENEETPVNIEQARQLNAQLPLMLDPQLTDQVHLDAFMV